MLEWEKSMGITKQQKKQKGQNIDIKPEDYKATKMQLEQYMHKIINRTIEAVFYTGTEFINNIFYGAFISQMDFSGVVTS